MKTLQQIQRERRCGTAEAMRIQTLEKFGWIDVKEHWPVFCQIVKVRCDTLDGKQKEFEAAVNRDFRGSYWIYVSGGVFGTRVEWPEWITHWKSLDGESPEFSKQGPL